MENNLPYDKVLFIGSFAQGELFDELFSAKAYVQFAANTVEKYYIDGIIEELDLDVDIVSALVTVPYPRSKLKKVGADETDYKDTKIVNVGFHNYPYINQMEQSRALRCYARKWARENKGKRVLVVSYALRAVFLTAAKEVKKVIPSATIISVVPDLPLYMHGNTTRFRKILTSVNAFLVDRARTCVDGYILYTKKMAEALKLEDTPWTVIEGLYDPLKYPETIVSKTSPQDRKFVFMYAGGISEKYGLKILADGFVLSGLENAELHIYGNGSFAEELVNYEKKYPSIRYFGSVDPDTMQERLRQADVLVNPRPSNDEFTKYSCPSKVIEYMATGRAVLMTRLEGVPDDYYNYVYTIDNESAEGMADAMKNVFADSAENRARKSALAKEYIYNEKNVGQQMKKVISLLDEIEHRRSENGQF